MLHVTVRLVGDLSGRCHDFRTAYIGTYVSHCSTEILSYETNVTTASDFFPFIRPCKHHAIKPVIIIFRRHVCISPHRDMLIEGRRIFFRRRYVFIHGICIERNQDCDNSGPSPFACIIIVWHPLPAAGTDGAECQGLCHLETPNFWLDSSRHTRRQRGLALTHHRT
jgi:hypothetical protein